MICDKPIRQYLQYLVLCIANTLDNIFAIYNISCSKHIGQYLNSMCYCSADIAFCLYILYLL